MRVCVCQCGRVHLREVKFRQSLRVYMYIFWAQHNPPFSVSCAPLPEVVPKYKGSIMVHLHDVPLQIFSELLCIFFYLMKNQGNVNQNFAPTLCHCPW